MKADLHVHTNFSTDGLSSPEEVVDAAIKKGLNYIVITDHDTLEGAELAKRYAEGKGIVVIVGQEVSTKEGHVIAVNIKREIAAGLSVHDTVNHIRKQGGYAIAPHPYFPGIGIGFSAFIHDFDAVERLNGTDYNILGETKTKRYCKRFGMPAVAGSDSHTAEDVGRCGIEFDGDFFDCLVSGNFKVFGSKIPLYKVLSWQIKYRFFNATKSSKLVKSIKITKKSDANGKSKAKTRSGHRRASKEESF